MNTYQFESVIDENGIVILPDDVRKLKKHRVKFILIDLDSAYESPVRFDDITKKYTAINEEDLNISEIYQQRKGKDEREITFD